MKTEIKSVVPGEKCEISGFIDTVRKQKTMLFVVLRDRSGKIQVAVDREKQSEIFETLDKLLPESVVRFVGKAIKAETVTLGGIEFVPESVEVESRAENLPVDKNSSPELKLDYRWLDLRDEKTRLIFEIRTFVEQKMREFFLSHGFIEIHTPKITAQCSEGGAEVFAVDYFGQKAYLTQSPQFYKQMAIAGGMGKVFEFGDYFRAENSFTSRHASESYCVDFEIEGVKTAYEIADFEEEWILFVLAEVKKKYGKVIKDVFGTEVELPKGRIPRFKLAEVFEIFEREYGVKVPEAKRLDLDPDAEKLICEYAKTKLGSDLVFITDYPAEARAFYTRKPSEDSLDSMSLDMLYRGWEVNSGAVRENRYDVLKAQIEEKGIDSAKMEGYLQFFKYGCPIHGGIGFGIDRFIARLLGLSSVKETIFLFRGPSRLVP